MPYLKLSGYFENFGAALLVHDQSIEQGRGHMWNNFVFKK